MADADCVGLGLAMIAAAMILRLEHARGLPPRAIGKLAFGEILQALSPKYFRAATFGYFSHYVGAVRDVDTDPRC